MFSKIKDIAIMGDGGWGTTLGLHLFKKGFKVSLWGAFADYVKYLRKYRINKKFLPGIRIPQGITISSDINEVIRNIQLLILAIPSQFMRQIIRRLRPYDLRGITVLSVTKGIENKGLKRMSEIIKEQLRGINLAVLSGPTIARELAKGLPTTAVVSSHSKVVAKELQEVFSNNRLRIYTNPDTIGVELGGSLKNIIAIACGISDGLGFGTNTKAALLSRGLAEITRLGVAMGAKTKTFSGISGLGDLVTTCISPYSRNRFVGEQLGKGKRLREVLSDMEMVAEGISTTKSAYRLSKKYNVEMPITCEVYSVLYKDKDPLRAVNDLMLRKIRQE